MGSPNRRNVDSCTPPCSLLLVFLRRQFIPAFLAQSKTRIKELRHELREMPSALTSDNEIWEAYRTVISQVEVELKEVLVSGSDIATVNIVPDVTALYRGFAEDIRKVCVPS